MPKEAKEFKVQSNDFLNGAFNFYSFGISLNADDAVEVGARYYNRLLEKRLADCLLREAVQANFVKSTQQTVKEFKKTQGEAQKMIDELKN